METSDDQHIRWVSEQLPLHLSPALPSPTRRHVRQAQITLGDVRRLLDAWYAPTTPQRRASAVQCGHSLDDTIADLTEARKVLLEELHRHDEAVLAQSGESH
jgi:hypothetical protein